HRINPWISPLPFSSSTYPRLLLHVGLSKCHSLRTRMAGFTGIGGWIEKVKDAIEKFVAGSET
ncbi:hypothetical protein, partial [Paraburkholderia tuberum]|uniref:hypothetical protein n=1 Tax=Paraburkholderia tuberum TaxID=157910 RepID=UPI001ABCC9D8